MDRNNLLLILTVIIVAILAVGAYISHDIYTQNSIPEGWEKQSFGGFTMGVAKNSSFQEISPSEYVDTSEYIYNENNIRCFYDSVNFILISDYDDLSYDEASKNLIDNGLYL